MILTPWFQVGTEGTPHRSGVYEWVLTMPYNNCFYCYATFIYGDNKIITHDGRFIGLTYEDQWRGVLK